MPRAEASPPAMSNGKRGRVTIPDSQDDDDAGPSNGKRSRGSRRVVASDDEDANVDELDSDVDMDGRREAAKKVKAERGQEQTRNGTTNGGQANGEEGEGEDEDDDANLRGVQRGHVAFRPEYDRDPKDSFVAGAIVRIKMRNFMTYDLVEFRLGPHLNMILGPNGTGKSSIAACIAIGLGFPPKVMGRANDLKAYVKQGEEDAETEIELKGPRGKKNVIIKRRFTKDNDTSEWFMNGVSSTKAAVLESVANLGIQANNLCSFLPQDKVADFAKMQPDVVLRETMRAAGDPRLTDWHEKLVQKGAKLRETESDLGPNIDKRNNLQQSVNRMEPDVRRFHEREERQMQCQMLQTCILESKRRVASAEVEEAKNLQGELKARQKAVMQRVKPLMELVNHLGEQATKANNRVTTGEGKWNPLPAEWKKAKKECSKIEDQSAKVDAELDDIKKQLKRREANIQAERQKVTACEEVLSVPRGPISEEYKQKSLQKKELYNQRIRTEQEFRNLDERLKESEWQLNNTNANLQNRSQELKQASDVTLKREQEARAFDASIAYALDWIEKNEMSLKGKVHKPLMISVDMTDRQYAQQVEACTSLAQRSTFVCENREDYNQLVALNKHFHGKKTSKNKEGKVSLFLQLITPTNENINAASPCSIEHLNSLGLDNFCINLVQAEPGMRAYLNEACGFNRSAVTRGPGSNINIDAILDLGISRWSTAKEVFHGQRTAYGKRDAQISSVKIGYAKALNLSVDQKFVKDKSEEIAAMKRTIQEMEKPMQKLREDLQRVGQLRKEAGNGYSVLDEETAELKSRLSKYASAQERLDNAKMKLAKLANEPSADVMKANCRQEKLKFAKAMLKPTQNHLMACEKAFEVNSAMIPLSLKALQAKLNHTAAEQRVTQGGGESEALEEEIREAGVRFAAARAKRKTFTDSLKVMLGGVSPELLEAVGEKIQNELPSPEALSAELAEVELALELGADVDQQFIERYNRINDELQVVKKSVEKQERELALLKRQINKILDVFDPALDALVEVASAKFSVAFERIGCSGEVKINRVEGNFAAWGIHILVSYRDGVNLQLLTGTRQSGGERSLATVTYLMSLSEVARTPFSLVDEINQGMDQKAERNVHNQLVEVTCGTDAGQYFLITPKLLTGLRYHERMKVLIVGNGTWLPNPSEKKNRFGNLAASLSRYVAAH